MWPFEKKVTPRAPAAIPQGPQKGYQRYLTRNDSWSNFTSGLGVSGYDKRMSTTFQASRVLTEQELNDIYRSEGLGQRGIEIFTEDMTKKPFTISGDPENLLAKELKRIKAYAKITECIRWALLHGGSIGVMGIDDGRFLDEPVDENNIKAVTHIKVFDRWRVTFAPSDLYSDPNSLKYGEPEWYTIFPISTGAIQKPEEYYQSLQETAEHNRKNPSMRNRYTYGLNSQMVNSFRVHESRIMRFNGKPIPERDRISNGGWHDSYLQGVYDRLRGLGSSYASLETVIDNFAIDVLRIEGLAGMISRGEESIAISRLHQIDQTKSALNTLLLDIEEEFQRNFAAVQGLSEVMNTLILGITAAWGIPVTRFMGQSPAGLNATGASDMQMHYDKIGSMQKAIVQDPCEVLVRYIMLSKTSQFKGTEPKDWEIEFPSLYEMTDLETATLRKTTAETDVAYITTGVLDPSEVAVSRFGGNKYSIDTNIDKNVKRVLPGGEDDKGLDE